MNGNISVQSKLGEGSRFAVELELHIQERQEDPKFWKYCDFSRILIVDHDRNTCQDVVKRMEKSGVVIDYATDSAQVMDLIDKANGKREKEEGYNLLLLDWNLPSSDSIQTMCMIHEKYADRLPIFIFSDCN